MKPQLIIVFACILCSGLCVVAYLADEQQPEENHDLQGGRSSARANFKMPKLFDFQMFKERFKKHYANAAELARRTKLYTARAFAVFISAVKYMHGKSTKFLKINSHSDWTEEERKASMNRMARKEPIKRSSSEKKTDSAPLPAANPADVERKLAEIAEHKDEDSDYAAIAAELEAHKRKKRTALEDDQPEGTWRKLSMDDLIGEPSGRPTKVPEKYTPSVPSNNPDYEQPETFSEGADDEQQETGEQVRPIPEQEAERIDQEANQGGYLMFILNSIKGATEYMTQGANNNGGRQLATAAARGRKKKTTKNIQSKRTVAPRQYNLRNKDQVYLDYRESGCILPPKQQSECGSCYIFATTALIEYRHCLQTGKLVPFSEQYPIDCGRNRDIEYMFGCNGGAEISVVEFYSRYGLELSADYPYVGLNRSCPYSPTIEPKHMGHTKVEHPEIVEFEEAEHLQPERIKTLLEQEGPLTITIITPDDFLDYGGGVDKPDCDLDSDEFHAMAIIGHGIEDGIEYWLIRNSHGPEFGVEGHYKLAKDTKEGCVIRVTYIKGQFKKNMSRTRRLLFDELKEKIRTAPIESV